MKGRPITATASGLCLAATLIAAQDAPVFELVSVRRSAPVDAALNPDSPGARSAIVVLPGGRFEARGQTLANLVRVAYGFDHVDPSRGVVEVDAGWQWTDRFDITAAADREWTTPPPGTRVPAELRTMLRALLEGRFELEARIETRRRNVLALRLLEQDGPPGPGLRPSADTCLGPFTDAPRNNPAPMPRCAFTQMPEHIEAGAVTLAEVAQLITRIEGLRLDASAGSLPVIVDQTGLGGRYDLALSIRFSIPDANAALARENRDRRSIAVRQAVETQLGLKLENARVPIPTLTIERARKPQED